MSHGVLVAAYFALGVPMIVVGVVLHCRRGGKWNDYAIEYEPGSRRIFLAGWATVLTGVLVAIFS